MRSVLAFSRLCIRQSLPRGNTSKAQFRRFRTAFLRQSSGSYEYSQRPLWKGKILWGAAATLSPAVFIQLSEENNQGTEETAESRMLEASRGEIAKKLPDDDYGLSRLRDGVVLFLDVY